MTTTLYVSNLVCPICESELPEIQVEVFGKHRRQTYDSPAEWPDIWVNESTVTCENGCTQDPVVAGTIEGRAIDSVNELLQDAIDDPPGPHDTIQERDDDY